MTVTAPMSVPVWESGWGAGHDRRRSRRGWACGDERCEAIERCRNLRETGGAQPAALVESAELADQIVEVVTGICFVSCSEGFRDLIQPLIQIVDRSGVDLPGRLGLADCGSDSRKGL
jgi:hypothetical protein